MKLYWTKFSGCTKDRVRNRSRLRVGKIGRGIILGLLTVLVAWRSFGQQTAPKQVPASPEVTRPPLPHIYMHFLLYQNHLDRAAAAHEAEGKDGSWLRDHFQQKLGFTPSQFANVRATGLRLESKLKELDSDAKAIAQTEHAARLQNPNAPRVPNPQLQDLMKQREELIQREIDSLNHG